MKVPFRLKIAILSLLLSGTLLAGFGIAFSIFTYRSGMDRMDRVLRSLIEARLRGPFPKGHWENLDESINFIYGDSPYHQLTMQVYDRFGELLYSSDNAPEGLTNLPRPPLPPGSQRSAPTQYQTPDFLSADPLSEEPLFHSRKRRPPAPETPPEPGATEFHTLNSPSGNWRVAIYRDSDMTAMLALNMNAFYAELHQFNTAFLVALPLCIILLGIAGWFLASRALQPLTRITAIAEAITARDLDQRIPDTHSDPEISRLITVINHMLHRLEKSYHQAVRFSADAAHELQTPLTILQGQIENAIHAADPASAEQQRLSELLADLSHLKSVIQKLLLLAHADEGRLKLQKRTVKFSEMLRDSLEDLEIIAPELRIAFQMPSELIMLEADQALLQQLLTNLTSNAAKYTSPGGTVQAKLSTTENGIQFALSNTAPPIPEADAPLLFQRFHRVDKSRNQAVPGTGLGLSLAQEIAKAHNGELILAPYANGLVTFILTLPQK